MRLLYGLVLMATVVLADGAGGLKWTVPAEWKSAGSKPMRVATYQVPAANGDREGGEIAVFYFGQGQGGGVDTNVKRWVGEFRRPDGSPADADAKIRTKRLNGLAVTIVDLSGTYHAGGVMMGGAPPPKPGFRLLGAIVEGPQGPVFFKFTGPAKTVAGAEKRFHKLLETVKKG